MPPRWVVVPHPFQLTSALAGHSVAGFPREERVAAPPPEPMSSGGFLSHCASESSAPRFPVGQTPLSRWRAAAACRPESVLLEPLFASCWVPRCPR